MCKKKILLLLAFQLSMIACMPGISHGASVTNVWGGARRCVILKSDGSVWSWGADYSGCLGNNVQPIADSHVPVQVVGPNGIGFFNAAEIMGGEMHSFARKSDGTVWSWGMDYFGQLGDGTFNDSYTPVQAAGLSGVKSLGGRGYHSMALKNDGTVWTWGRNRNGEIGNGTNNGESAPPYGVNTPYHVAQLSGVTAVSGGGFHSMAIMPDGTLQTWGMNQYGQLGVGDTTDRYTPVQVSGISGVKSVSCGWFHTVALTNDGTVWTWGQNTTGQIGDNTTTNRLTPYHVPGLTNVIAVSGGDCHSAALKSDGTVWTWGCNGQNGNGNAMVGNYELGDGTNIDRHTPVQVKNLTNVVLIAARDYHNIAVKSDGTVWTWGFNADGQLGDGTTTDRSIPVAVIGLGGSSNAAVPVFDKAGWFIFLIGSGLAILYYLRKRAKGLYD